LLGLTNSITFQSFVSLQMAFGSYEVGVVQRTPIPDLSSTERMRLGELALSIVNLKRNLDRSNEISHVFHLPALLQVSGETLVARVTARRDIIKEVWRQLEKYQLEIDRIAFRLYSLEVEDRWAIEESLSESR
jgi:hypothetical protein